MNRTENPGTPGTELKVLKKILRLLWVLANKQSRSHYESMGKEDKIGTEAF